MISTSDFPPEEPATLSLHALLQAVADTRDDKGVCVEDMVGDEEVGDEENIYPVFVLSAPKAPLKVG